MGHSRLTLARSLLGEHVSSRISVTVSSHKSIHNVQDLTSLFFYASTELAIARRVSEKLV